MRFPIDVIFLDPWDWPIDIRQAVRPWRVVACRRASAVVEMRAGDADHFFIQRL